VLKGKAAPPLDPPDDPDSMGYAGPPTRAKLEGMSRLAMGVRAMAKYEIERALLYEHDISV